jgi:haloalkane dehalogenase
MEITIPNELKNEYPFVSNFFELDSKNQMHYIDEGHGDVVIMLHGNPTWSFFYRNVIKNLSKTNRVIVPDHLGCGLSSKNEHYDYTLKNHIDNVEKLVKHLKIEKYSLIVHDWGGAIGLGLATRAPEKVEKIIAMNTAAFTSSEIPFRINILRNPIGEFVIRSMNGFALPATFMAVNKKMSPVIKKGFLLPYNNFENRIATAKFVRDIPLSKDHTTYPILKDIEDHLIDIKSPILLLWGEKDFCFNMNFYQRWQDFFPTAAKKSFPNAGHYLLEDEYENVFKEIKNFLGV